MPLFQYLEVAFELLPTTAQQTRDIESMSFYVGPASATLAQH